MVPPAESKTCVMMEMKERNLHIADLRLLADQAYLRFVQDLQALVEIESESGDIHGSTQIARWLKEKLIPLGAAIEERPTANGVHVVARLKGSGKGRYVFMMHTDTVHPRGALHRQPFRVDEQGRAYGPGAGDSKASVVFGLAAAEALQKLAPGCFQELVLYFDCEEEIGSADEEAIVVELARQADAAFVLDTARPDWGIVTRRKGIQNYEIQVFGIPGHAGNAPQATASATMELAHQLTQLYKLASPTPGEPGDYDREILARRGIRDHGQFIPDVSINAGVIGTSNTKLNVVPAYATTGIEVRAYRQLDLQRIDRAIRVLAAQPSVPGTQVKVTPGRALPPMEKGPDSAALVERYRDIVERLYGATAVEWSAGGITVGNLSATYTPTIDALAVEVHHEHDLLREYADLTSFAPRLVCLAALIADLSSPTTP